MTMDIRLELNRQGAIRINTAEFLHLDDASFLLALDCMEKCPDSIVSQEYFDGAMTVQISLFPDKWNTLHVRDDAPRDDRGEYESTFLDVVGLRGDWHVTAEYGKWGPHIYGIKLGARDESWPSYHQDHEEDTEG